MDHEWLKEEGRSGYLDLSGCRMFLNKILQIVEELHTKEKETV